MPLKEAVAIVGIGGIFPDAPTLDRFWENIRSGHAATREVPPGRWAVPVDAVFDPEVGAADRVYSRRGCFIEKVPRGSDFSGLGVDTELLDRLDPLFRVLLHAGRQAFEDGVTAPLDRSRVGVIVGNLDLPTEKASELARSILGRTFEEKLLGTAITEPDPVEPLNRYVSALPAGILARALGLSGGSCALDAACASSLYAVKLAVDELLSGRADAMLAGGVSRPDPLYTQMGFSQLRALSPTGVCSPFDAKGDGLVVGEGSGIVLLKRLSDALRDGDRIYALIRGAGLSNDVGGSLLAPLSEGQLRAMRAAYSQAGWEPGDVDLFECHATGTPVGDAVEFESLRALRSASASGRQSVIGSVKSNIGHLLTAAGSAALIKVILAMKAETLPPTANFSTPSKGVVLEGSPFCVLTAPKPWERRDDTTPRRAAVSAFGFGGINAHLLVEEWIDAPPAEEPANLTETTPDEPIAIVGIDAHFGPWDSLARFRQRVFGSDATGPTLPKRWWGTDKSAWLAAQGIAPETFRGYYCEPVTVAPGAFRIPPRELEEMLPQQLLMLQTADAALSDAGLGRAPRTGAGVFIGLGLDLNTTNFTLRWSFANRVDAWAKRLGLSLSPDARAAWLKELRDAASPPLTANRTMGALGSIVASRIAREFSFGGPSFAVSAEDASGLRALEMGVRALRRKEIDLALVGAVDLAGDVRSALSTYASRNLPAGAETLVGEGSAAFVLKRLSDAEASGDRVYAVIRGISSASAKGSGYAEACGRALESACAEAKIDPAAVTLVGGDEAAPADLPPSTRGPRAHAPFKGEIGDTGAASGLASLAQAVLSLHHAVLPPTRDGERTVPPRYWLRNQDEGPRIAAVTSASVDGNVTRVLLEGYDACEPPGEILPAGPPEEAVFLFEGENGDDVRKAITDLKAMAATASSLPALFSLWLKKRPLDPSQRLCASVVPRSVSELLLQLDALDDPLARRPGLSVGDPAGGVLPPHARDRVFYTPEPLGPQGKIAFVYPGSGNHFAGMGRDISARWPRVFDRQDGANLYLRDQFQPHAFWNGADMRKIEEDHHAMIFGQVAFGTACSDLVRSFGIEPQAAIGYSLGESAALFSLGAWRDRDLMLQRMLASTLFTEDMAGPCRAARQVWKLKDGEEVDWTLGVVNLPAEEVRKALKNRKRVYLLIVNTPGECVIGGQGSAVRRLVEKLGCSFFELKGVTAVHCEVAEPVAKPYRELHLYETTPPPGVTYYSGSFGRPFEVTTDNAADSILEGALRGVDYPKTIEAAYADGARIFLEMGPGGSCARMIGEILKGRPHLARSAAPANQDGVSAVLRLVAQMASERVPVNLSPLQPTEEPVQGRVSGITVPHGGAPFEIPVPKRVEAPSAPAPKPVSTVPAAAPVEPASAIPAVPTGNPLLDAMKAAAATSLQAHETYLRFARQTSEAMTQALALQTRLLRQAAAAGIPLPAQAELPVSPSAPAQPTQRPVFDRQMCMEFAIGSIAKMLGPEFAEVDSHPTRVRLPDEPLMLVDRITALEGEPRSMTSGRVVTEHDVKEGAWYLDGGRIPTCVAVEAGQADLFLSGYLGIDFITKGEAVYRLLDAEVTFHRPLPQVGEVIRYDIRIDHFFRQDKTYLFRFQFDSTVGGEPLLTMRKGCAGFFSEAELAAGKGIVHTRLDLLPQQGKRPADWRDLVPMAVESYDERQIDALYAGDLAGCFGPPFAGLPLKRPYTLPGGLLKLVDRVVSLDPKGGRFGIGTIRAEADIHPDDWFLTCHFSDDNVMPGTLMYECCLHTLRIYLLRMGWVGESGTVVSEPVPGITSGLKCRGQVTEKTRTVTYEITLKEIGYRPEPFVIVDALMYADGKPIVEISNMTARLSGLTRQSVEALWSGQRDQGGQSPVGAVPTGGKKPAIYDYDRILAFSAGNPSEAFGEPYRVFDGERRIARLPRPPFQFLDRITAIDAEPWKMVAGGVIEAQYDVPPDAWYFAANRQHEMPFSVILEIGLQPCGWLAAYVGSALTSPIDLSFRNLDGTAVLHRPVTPETGTLTTTVKITQVSSSGGMIIQGYDFEVCDAKGPVYGGKTVFGFFSKESLAQQVGLRDAERHAPTEDEIARGASFPYPEEAPFPEKRMRMVDAISLYVADGGSERLGFIRGTKIVDPTEWFFDAHFYQDPVCPGSLGLESFLQLLKVASARRWGATPGARFHATTPGRRQEWHYRGQIIPTNSEITIEAVITSIDDEKCTLTADGYLVVDGKIIYAMKDFSVTMESEG